MQGQILDLRDENIKLREELKSFRKQLALKEKLEFRNGVYWIKNDSMTPDGSDTPICPKCYAENDYLVMRLKIYKGDHEDSVFCPKCKQNFYFG